VGGGAAGRGEDRAAAPGRLGSVEKKKKGKGKGRLTGGAQVSAAAKEKEEREVGRRGEARRAGRPFGPKGKQGMVFLFFLFLFQTSFQTTFLFKFKSNSFKLFLKNFINFFLKPHKQPKTMQAN
jgi:hypothetical protein